MNRNRLEALGRRDFLKYSAAAGVFGSLSGSPAERAWAAAGDTVHFYSWSAAVDLVKSHIAAFEKKTGTKINYSTVPWAQYRESMVTKFVGGAPMDNMYVSDTWLPEWAEAGWIAPIDDMPQLMKYNAETEDFCTQSMIYKRRQYGLTYYTDYMGFLYDEAMLKKAGIAAPPRTWDEVTKQSLAIKKAGLSEYPIMLALAKETWLIEYASAIVFSHGGRFADDAGNALMHDPEKGAVQALKWIVDAVNVHKIVSPACVQTGELVGIKAFAAGTHAFALEPKYRLRLLNDPQQSKIAGGAKLALMPMGPNGSHATVGWMRFHGMSTPAKKDRKRAENAAQLIEWFGGKADGEYRFQKLLFLDGGAGFGTKPLFKDPEVRAVYGKSYGSLDIIEKQQTLARKKDVIAPWYGEWDEVNGTLWQEAILQKERPQDAMKKSADKWTQLKKATG
jgi:multiple sugar transport system substrate-binding protein